MHSSLTTTLWRVSEQSKAEQNNNIQVRIVFFILKLPDQSNYSETPQNRTPLGPEEMSGLEGCPVYWGFTYKAILCSIMYYLTVSTSTWYTSTNKAHQ